MIAWLKNHGISYDDSDLKVDLMEKIVAAQPTVASLTDIEAEGHEVVRLPVAHCELSPTYRLNWPGQMSRSM